MVRSKWLLLVWRSKTAFFRTSYAGDGISILLAKASYRSSGILSIKYKRRNVISSERKVQYQFDRSEGAEVSDCASKSSIEPISRSVIGRKFESAFDGGNGSGTKSCC